MHPQFPFRLGAMMTIALVISTGCATRYEVKVDAVARINHGLENYSSYRIREPQSQPGLEKGDFQHTARLVKTALSGHGLYEAPTGTAPDLMIEIDFGMESPRVKQETIVLPIYGRTPVPSTPLLDDAGENRGGRAGSVQQAADVVGYQQTTRAVVVREKFLLVSGRESQPAGSGRPANEVFNIRVTTENESSDFRAHVPILAGALMEKLGQTTDGIVTASLPANDDSVTFVQRGL
jgi:hypothetical protein